MTFRTNIRSTDWTPPTMTPTVASCSGKQVSIESFGLTRDGHPGFPDVHDEVTPNAMGRHVIVPNCKTSLVFRWRIAGYDNASSAQIEIYRHGSNRIIGMEVLDAAEGTRETFGTVAGAPLDEAALALIPNHVYTAAAGPYMARLTIDPNPGATFVGGALRVYFEVLPIAVIGAGAAGLRAAEVLLRKNQSVILIEAADRVGGRALTVRSKNGKPIDLGCQWLQNRPENPLVLLPLGKTFPHAQDERYLIEGKDVTEAVHGHITTAAKIFASEDDPLDIPALAMLERKLFLDLQDKKQPKLQKDYEAEKLRRATEDLADYDPRTGPEPSDDVLKQVLRARTPSLRAQAQAQMLNAAVVELRTKWRDDEEVLTRRRQKAIQERAATMPYEPTWETVLGLERTNWRQAAEVQAQQLLAEQAFLLAVAQEAQLEEGADLDQFSAAARLETEAKLPKDEDIDGCELVDECPQPDVLQTGQEGGNLMTVEGLGTFVQRYAEESVLARGAYVVLRTQCVATKIDTTGAFVRIATSDTPVEALAAIVAVPTPIVAGPILSFDPPLPTPIRRAFQMLPMAHYKKIVLFFNEDIFPKEEEQQEQEEQKEQEEQEAQTVEDKMFFTIHEGVAWKFLHLARIGAVVGFVGGRAAEAMDFQPDQTVSAAALAALSAGLGRDIRSKWTGEMLTSRWAADMRTFGAYSTTAPGGFGARSMLRRAIVRERILFAGEALWPGEYGTLHGAYQSGEVAAKMLLGKMGL